MHDPVWDPDHLRRILCLCCRRMLPEREKKKKLKVISKEPVSKEEIIDIKKARIWLNINNMDISYVDALDEYEKNGGIIIRQ